MRKLLYAVSAVAIGVTFGATAQAETWDNTEVNIANVAINWVPGFNRVAIDASVNISADRGGEIGDGLFNGDIGKIETTAIGAVNESQSFVGRDSFEAGSFVSGRASLEGTRLKIDDVRYRGYEEGGRWGDSRERLSIDNVEYWSVDGSLAVRAGGYIEFEGVPHTNVYNVALNFERIDGSVTIDAYRGGEIGGVGNISATAVGALNRSVTTVGIPGHLGQIDFGD